MRIHSVFWFVLVCFCLLGANSSRAQDPDDVSSNTAAADEDVNEESEDVPSGVPLVDVRDVPAPILFPAEPLTDDTVLSPTGTPIPLSSSGSSVTVITEEQIQATEQTSVAEVLRNVEGLDVVRQGGPGGLTSVFLRGANSQHTKVLLDGVPMNDPSNATRGFDFSTLVTENIERIEVLRGPQSMLYGSDAIGGVINIVTKRGEGPLSVRTNLMGGSFGTHNEGLNLSGGNDRYYYSFGGFYIDTDGISAASSALGNTESDNYRNMTFSTRVGWTPSDLLNIDYVARYVDADAQIDAFSFVTQLPFDTPGSNLSEVFYQRIQAQSLALDGLIEQTIGFNWVDYDRKDTSPLAFVPQFRGTTRELNYVANLVLLENNVLSAGFNHLNEDAATGGAFGNPRVTQNLTGVFVQDQITLWDRWYTTIGFRWDDHSTAGRAETYRLTTLYDLPCLGGAFHGSIGTGFRAPALAENLFQFGNPDLRPERVKGWDLGWRQKFCCDRVTIDATYFRNDFDDLIVFDFITFALENVGRARSSGVEVVGRWQMLPCWALNATYTRTDTRNLDTGNELDRRPQDKATVGLRGLMLDGRADVYLYMLYVGDRRDRDFRLDEYARVNLALAYRPRCHVELFARADNLFDARYEEVAGYGVPGVSGYGGARLMW